ncbi:MAG: 4-hydroxy-tetrahydrodipicolinate reductase [Candidatus Nanopelagicales bacterium]
MKVGLIGFGKTGREVATALLMDKSVQLRWVVRNSDRLEHRSVPEFLGIESDEPGEIHSRTHTDMGELLESDPVDVIIDFSSETGLASYGEAAADKGVAIVTAISSYSEAIQRDLKRLSTRTKVLWSPNITVGINFMMLAAQTLQRIAPHVDVEVVEEHFQKKQEVSGTALRLGRALGVPDANVHSIRAGGIIGVHEILFGFPAQTVRLRHESISREAFGNGAIFAAKHLVAQEGVGLFRMEDLLLPYFAEEADRAGTLSQNRKGAVRGKIASSLRTIARKID